MDLSGIFLAFYRPANRFHVSTGRVRLVTVVPWHLVSGPTSLNVQRAEDDRHATRWQRLKCAGVCKRAEKFLIVLICKLESRVITTVLGRRFGVGGVRGVPRLVLFSAALIDTSDTRNTRN